MKNRFLFRTEYSRSIRSAFTRGYRRYWSLNCELCRCLSLSRAGIRLERSHSYPLLRPTFQLSKSECSKRFESERFTMTVARIVNRGEMFCDCGCANKWEWVSVNGSRIGLVGRRREKRRWDTRNSVCTCVFCCCCCCF